MSATLIVGAYLMSIAVVWAVVVLFNADKTRALAVAIVWPIVAVVFVALFVLIDVPVRLWHWIRHPAPGIK